MPKEHLCIDCKKDPPPTVRLLWAKLRKDEAPRCGEHGRAFRKRQLEASQVRRWLANFGITEEEYWALYEAQGRKCAFPRCRAIGKVKRLAVDHDRALAVLVTETHPIAHAREKGCRACIRGLLCGPHNHDLMGRFAVDLEDALVYRDAPPARLVLAA